MTDRARIAALERMLERGQDTPLLRFSLGAEYLKAGDHERAASHLEAAVRSDPGYSAAWKLLGKAQTGAGQLSAAISSYRRGIGAAEAGGDRQAAREMRVFLKRLEREREDAGRDGPQTDGRAG